MTADETIFQTALSLPFLGKDKNLTSKLHQFSLTESYQTIQLELDLIAEISAEVSAGKHFDLASIFQTVNCEYFQGLLSQPRLTWAKLPPSRFAHYERVRDKVVFSTRLDSETIPLFVLEFIMYHELLHKHLGCKFINNRTFSHTPEFRQKEKQFKFYEEVQVILKKLSQEILR